MKKTSVLCFIVCGQAFVFIVDSYNYFWLLNRGKLVIRCVNGIRMRGRRETTIEPWTVALPSWNWNKATRIVVTTRIWLYTLNSLPLRLNKSSKTRTLWISEASSGNVWIRLAQNGTLCQKALLAFRCNSGSRTEPREYLTKLWKIYP